MDMNNLIFASGAATDNNTFEINKPADRYHLLICIFVVNRDRPILFAIDDFRS